MSNGQKIDKDQKYFFFIFNIKRKWNGSTLPSRNLFSTEKNIFRNTIFGIVISYSVSAVSYRVYQEGKLIFDWPGSLQSTIKFNSSLVLWTGFTMQEFILDWPINSSKYVFELSS